MVICLYSEVKVWVTQSCLTLYSPMDCRTPAPLCTGFSRQEYWSHSLLQGIFLNPGIKPGSPALQADSLLSEPPGSF